MVPGMLVNEQLQRARATITQLLSASKTLSVYSEEHPSCEQAVHRFHRGLLSFLEEYGQLQIGIERDRLLYEGSVLHAGPANEENIGFSLFRDGVKSLSFLRGIEFVETQRLVQILHRHRQLDERSSEDLVTALWEANLPHVRHQATELVLEEDSAAGGLEGPEEAGPQANLLLEAETASPDQGDTAAEGLAPQTSWGDGERDDPLPPGLAFGEMDILKAVVREELDRNPRQRVVLMLLEILYSQEDPELLRLSVDFLREEMAAALMGQEFDYATGILRRLRSIRDLPSRQGTRTAEIMDPLFLHLASEDFLRILRNQWSDPKFPHLSKVKQLLQLLPPAAVSAIGPMLSDPLSAQSKGVLSEVVICLATEDMAPLENLLDHASRPVLESLVPILRQLDGERPIRRLLSLTRHGSERIRALALDALIKKRVWVPQQLFHLIHDQNDRIRKMFLAYLSSRRCEEAEQLLVDYLAQQRTTGGTQAEPCFDCIRALGDCGSSRSVAVLLEVLSRGIFTSRLLGSPVRKAAALALRRIGTGEALEVLDKAARSYYPGVRQAARAANLS